MQCTRETTKPKLYESILKKAGIPSEVSESKTVTGGAKLKISLSAEGNLPFIAKAEGAATGETNRDTSNVVASRNFEIDPDDANDVVGALKAAEFAKFIIVEDFHYLAEEVQRSMAVDLKVFHENSNLVFIIVGVWLEADRHAKSGRRTNKSGDHLVFRKKRTNPSDQEWRALWGGLIAAWRGLL